MRDFGAKAAMTIGFACAMALALPVFVSLSYYAAPSLQARLLPILDVQLMEAHRSGQIGVWKVRFHKRYSASLLSVDYFVRTSTNQRIPIKAYRCDSEEKEISGAPASHVPGETWTTLYCTIITDDIDGADGVSIEGVATYRAWPYLWEVIQPIARFSLKPA